MILERQAFHLDQLRYLEQRAKHDAQLRLVSGGQLPANLPPGFEIGGPPQPQPQVQVANFSSSNLVSVSSSSTSVISAPPTSLTVSSNASLQITQATVSASHSGEIPPRNFLH